MTLNYLGEECLNNHKFKFHKLEIPDNITKCQNIIRGEILIRKILKYNNLTNWATFNLSNTNCSDDSSEIIDLSILDSTNNTLFYTNESKEEYKK